MRKINFKVGHLAGNNQPVFSSSLVHDFFVHEKSNEQSELTEKYVFDLVQNQQRVFFHTISNDTYEQIKCKFNEENINAHFFREKIFLLLEREHLIKILMSYNSEAAYYNTLYLNNQQIINDFFPATVPLNKEVINKISFLLEDYIRTSEISDILISLVDLLNKTLLLISDLFSEQYCKSKDLETLFNNKENIIIYNDSKIMKEFLFAFRQYFVSLKVVETFKSEKELDYVNYYIVSPNLEIGDFFEQNCMMYFSHCRNLSFYNIIYSCNYVPSNKAIINCNEKIILLDAEHSTYFFMQNIRLDNNINQLNKVVFV